MMSLSNRLFVDSEVSTLVHHSGERTPTLHEHISLSIEPGPTKFNQCSTMVSTVEIDHRTLETFL